MPAATTKADLITVTEQEFHKLSLLIGDISRDVAMRKREDDTSIKDLIIHRAHWITLFLGWYADGQAGKPVHFPAKGYKWNDLKSYNAALRDTTEVRSWADARASLFSAHVQLIGFLGDHDDAALYGGPMKGANNAWTTGRWAEAAGASHYRSTSKWIRACLRADKAAES